MTISECAAHQRQLRWNIWWHWALISLLGVIVAVSLERALPDALRYPLADENIWLEQPWRVAALTFVYYTPISLAQWLVLRRSVRRAWWWLIVTLGGVVVVYPGSIWALYSLALFVGRSGLELPGAILLELAWWVWFLGLGGGSVYLVAQWIALRRWTRNTKAWAVWFVATSVGWFLMLRLIATLSAGFPEAVSDGGSMDLLQAIAFASLYQLTLGGALAAILQLDARSEMPQTAPGGGEGR